MNLNLQLLTIAIILIAASWAEPEALLVPSSNSKVPIPDPGAASQATELKLGGWSSSSSHPGLDGWGTGSSSPNFGSGGWGSSSPNSGSSGWTSTTPPPSSNGWGSWPGESLPKPTPGCLKLTGISKLPLTSGQTCDAEARDCCGVISPNAVCIYTALDMTGPSGNPYIDPILTCQQPQCNVNQAPTGLPGVLTCGKTKGPSNCPPYATASYDCSVCGSDRGTLTTTRFCCTG